MVITDGCANFAKQMSFAKDRMQRQRRLPRLGKPTAFLTTRLAGDSGEFVCVIDWISVRQFSLPQNNSFWVKFRSNAFWSGGRVLIVTYH